MIRNFMIWILPAVVFLLGGFAYGPVFRSTCGGASWVMAHVYLNKLHANMGIYKEMHGTIPEEKIANGVISKLWIEKDYFSIKFDDPAEEKLAMITGGFNYRELKLWGKPPKYIISNDLPDGYGLYMEGEDRVTHSNGNDPDDLNSWDENSSSSYAQRSQREHDQKSTVYMLIVFGTALFAFVLGGLIWKKQ